MQSIVAYFCINDADRLEPELDKAVNVAVEKALIGPRNGVLVVRHDNRNFTVGLSSEVPFGTILELDQRKSKAGQISNFDLTRAPGKPRPATYDHAVRLVGLPSEECVVVEDAVSGVQAGQAGSFHSVTGVDCGAGQQTLLDAGQPCGHVLQPR